MKSHVLLWLALCFLLLLAAPVVMSDQTATGRITAEQQAAEAIFGREQTMSIAQRAHRVHDLVIVQSGIQGLINAGYTTEDALRSQQFGRDTQRNIGSVFNKYLKTLTTQIYGYFFRFQVMVHWTLYLAVFLAAVVFDGVAQRKVKTETAGLINPSVYAISQHMMVLVVFLPIVYLLAPFHITPWFMPGWAIAMALPMSRWLSNAAWVD